MRQALGMGAVGFMAYVATVLVLLRAFRRTAPPLVVTGSSVGVYGAMVVAAAGLSRGVMFWPASVTYWFLALCFLLAFGAIYKSISLRILRDLLDRPDRSESYEAIVKRYVQHESYQDRLRILVSDGLATREAAGFQLTHKGRRIAAAAHAIQRFFKIERSG